jgi:hypothetical protein
MKNKIHKKDVHLNIKFILEEELFSKKQLDILEDIISAKLPIWKQELKVLPAENAPQIATTSESSLFEAVSDVCPLRTYGLGNAQLIGGYKGIYFYLDSSRKLFTTNNNTISVEILKISEIEGQCVNKWTMDFFSEITKSLPIRYARAYQNAEFITKNFIDTSVMGVNIYKSLPGLYWLNYFGIPYVKMIGEEKITDSISNLIEKHNGGILIYLDENPFNWNTKSYQDLEEKVIACIGKQYFFLKDDPYQLTVAPDFANEYHNRQQISSC